MQVAPAAHVQMPTAMNENAPIIRAMSMAVNVQANPVKAIRKE